MERLPFEMLLERAAAFPHTSLQYVDSEDLAGFELLRADGELLLLRGYNAENRLTEYHWAARTAAALTDALAGRGEAYLMFVPQGFRNTLHAAGFADYSCWRDYLHGEVQAVAAPESPADLLTVAECGEASALTLACRFQSRGFTGEEPAFFEGWLSGEAIHAENSRLPAVLVCRRDGNIAGLVCVCLYGKPESPTLWVREIAVRPENQRQGIGGLLLSQALWYGKSHGAARAFLAADECNTGAIRLYERMGFRRQGEEGQLNMLREG